MKRFSDILVGRDELQNEPNLKSVQYCISELLNVFEDSAQCKCAVTTSVCKCKYFIQYGFLQA